LQLAFAAYAWGKPPEKIEGIQFPQQNFVLRFGHERPGYDGPGSERLKQLPATGDGNSEP
jgi:hypothetical protein